MGLKLRIKSTYLPLAHPLVALKVSEDNMVYEKFKYHPKWLDKI